MQRRLISRVQELCRLDRRLDAALMYGSFAQGEADAYSDIEFWLFLRTEHRADVDPVSWCNQIAVTTHVVPNEFGAYVAFFPGLIRGEFHFASTDDIATVGTWPARSGPADHMIVLDRNDRLRPVLDALPAQATATKTWDEANRLCGRFANWLVLAHHVAHRGEVFRALDALGQVHRHLLWMARLVEDSTQHWLTPSRKAEAELSQAALETLVRTTATAEYSSIHAAIHEAWRCGRGYWTHLAARHDNPTPDALFAELDEVLAG